MDSWTTFDTDMNNYKGQLVTLDVLSISKYVHSLTYFEKYAVEYFTTEKKKLT